MTLKMMMILCTTAVSLAFTSPGDEGDGFLLSSSQAIMGVELGQGRYAVAGGRFEPATFGLQGTEHTPTPPLPSLKIMKYTDDHSSIPRDGYCVGGPIASPSPTIAQSVPPVEALPSVG